MVTFSGNYGFLPTSHTHEIVTHILRVVSLSLDEFFTFGELLEKSSFKSKEIIENPFVISEALVLVRTKVKNLAEYFTFEQGGFTPEGFTSTGFTVVYDVARVVTKFRSLSESFILTDAVAQAQIILRDITESFTFGESLTRLLSKARSLAESFTVGEALTRVATKLRTFVSVESFTMTDSAAAAKVKERLLAETVTFGEALTRLSLKARALAESFITGHTLTRATIKARAPGFPETFTIGESLTKIKTSTKSLAESFTIGEALTRLATKTRSLAESFSITDLATAARSKSISIAEIPIVFAEQAIPAFVKKSVKNLTETVTFGETLTRIKTSIRSLAESFSISEAITFSQIMSRALSETFTITDSLTRLKSRTLALAETITFSDSVTRTRQFVKSLAESFSLTDALAQAKIKGRLLLESFTIGEFVSAIRLLAGAPRWIVSGQVADFQDSIENLVKAYVNTNWTLATPALGTNPASQTQIDKFAYDGFRTYYIKVREIASDVQTRRIRFNTYEFETPIEFDLFSRRLSKGEAFTELNDMINELMRIFGTFQHEAMFGIQGVTFNRISPIEREKSAAQTIWARRLSITLSYYKTSTIG